jgi:hypothetical protein
MAKKYICTACEWIYDPAVLMAELLRELPLKIFLMIGSVPTVVPQKRTSKSLANSFGTSCTKV